MLFAKTKNYYDITLALAGIFQAILLVQNMAKTGKADEQAFLTIINTIYKISPQNVNAVYDGPESLYLGLKEVVNFFDARGKSQDPDFTRYLLGLLYLEKKLSHNKKMQNNLRERINRAINQARFFPTTHPSILANLGDAYSQTLGKFNYRIAIVGRTNYLKRHDFMDKMRALLLAGVRSAVLWKQVGGSRWELLWGRKKILEIAKNLCKQCEKKKP